MESFKPPTRILPEPGGGLPPTKSCTGSKPKHPQCEQNSVPGIVSSRACVLYGARWVLAPVQDVIHLIHGPTGCAYYSSKVRGKDYVVFSTAMNEQDVVFGGTQKLRRSISEAVRLQPSARAVLVYNTCTSGLIGEDVTSVCRDVSTRLGLPVIPVNCPGFCGMSQSTGHDEAARVLLEHFIDRSAKGEVLENGVNILGEFDVGGDLKEIEKLLTRLDLNIICAVSGRATPENMALARRAALDIVHCRRTGGLLARLMEERYGIPQLKVSFFGLTETAKAIQNIAIFFNRDLEDVEKWVHEEVVCARQKAEPYLQKLAGKRVVMFFGASRMASMACVFGELGMEIVLSGSQCGSKSDYREANQYLRDGALVIDDAGVHELMKFLHKNRPHLMVGGNREKFMAHKLGIPFLVFPQQNSPYAGFNGFVNLAREAAAIVTAPVWDLIHHNWGTENESV